MRGNPWTSHENETLRALYGKLPRWQIAQRLQRSAAAVHCQAHKLGLTFDRRAEMGDAFTAFLKERNAAGYSDSEVAREWGCHQQTATAYRKRLNLSSNRFGSRHRQKIRKRVRQQCLEAGVKNLRGLRTLSMSLDLTKKGYPEGINRTQAKIIDALRAGPRNKRLIVEALGYKWRGCASLRCAPRGSLLEDLVRRGAVVKLGRNCGRIPGEKNGDMLYALAPSTAADAA